MNSKSVALREKEIFHCDGSSRSKFDIPNGIYERMSPEKHNCYDLFMFPSFNCSYAVAWAKFSIENHWSSCSEYIWNIWSVVLQATMRLSLDVRALVDDSYDLVCLSLNLAEFRWKLFHTHKFELDNNLIFVVRFNCLLNKFYVMHFQYQMF